MLKRKRKSTPEITTRQSPSTGTTEIASASSQQTSASATPSLPSYHSTIYRLPLKLFFEVAVTEDLKHLIIDGRPTDLQLQDAYEHMIGEISSLVRTDQGAAILRITKRIGLMQWQILYVDYALNWLRVKYERDQGTDQDTLTELRRLGYNYNFDTTNRYQYLRELEMVESRAKTLVRTRKDLLDEYHRMVGEDPKKGNQAPKRKTREDVEHECANLERYQGYQFNRETMMTSQYYTIMSQYNQAQKAAKQKANGGR